MTVATWDKDPAASLPYALDWSSWLSQLSGETIGSVVWTVPTGLTLVSQSATTTVATVRLSGGTAGERYVIGCQITTAPTGYVDERSIVLYCKER